MKYVLGLLGLLGVPAFAETAPLESFVVEQIASESLCGVTNENDVLAELNGDWVMEGGLAFQAQGDTMLEPVVGTVYLSDDGFFSLEMQGERGDVLFLRPNRRPFDAEKLSALFERAGVSWIDDAITETSCAPEDLMQLRATSNNPDGDYNQVTIVAYSTAQVLMIVEVETIQEGVGLAFVTVAALMTR